MKPVDELRSQKLVSHARLTARLGLTQYNKNAPITDLPVAPKSIKLMLSQHIGAPAEATVKKGDTVTAGQIVARASEGKLGVNIHTPFAGKVTEATDKFIKVTL